MEQEILPTITDLSVFVEERKSTALVAFSTTNGLDPIIEEIKRRVAKEKLDVTTPKGRERIGTLARQVGSAKKRLEEMALGLTEDWRLKVSAVNSEKARMIKEMDALRDSILAPRIAYEEIEKNRVAAHNAALDEINNHAINDILVPSSL